MTLLDLNLQLEQMGVLLLPLPDDGSLELFVPDGVELPDEVAAAIREHKPTLLAWSARRGKSLWAAEWQERWAALANELETERGLKFPESEIEAYRTLLAMIDPYDAEERAGIMEFDSYLPRETAELAAGLLFATE